MKKTLFFLFIFFIILSSHLFAEELQFRVLERAKYIPLLNNSSTPVHYLEKDDIVTCHNSINYSQDLTEDYSFSLAIRLLKDGRDWDYVTEAEKLMPLNTVDTFSQNIAINHSRDNEELWVPSYYADVLSSQTRDTLIGFESYWLPWESIDDYTGDILNNWYMSYGRYGINYYGEVMFYNAVIRLTITRYCLMIKEIQKTAYGYNVICIRANSNTDPKAGSNFNWSYVKDNEYFLLLLKEDGDYLDLYVNNFLQRFGSLIKVRQEFAKQFELLIKTNTCDLSRVQFPRRADGSRDYSLPTPHTVEEIPPLLETDNTAAEVSQTDDFIQSGKSSQSLPLWALIAIIGGAVVVAGGVVLFVVKRKK
ncbi:MAG: hypothetical protein LBI28_01885 [Treponema sp.]|jgi:hypothetical protein|nr:hypothetical protein [Treponema sp.]